MIKKHALYNVGLKVILENDRKEILGLWAGKTGMLANSYDLPGGRIDTDEIQTPLEEIIKRELHEEIGSVKYALNPKPVAVGRHYFPASITGKDKDLKIFLVFFKARYLSGEIKISGEHKDYKWLDLKKEPLEKFFKHGLLEGTRMAFASQRAQKTS